MVVKYQTHFARDPFPSYEVPDLTIFSVMLWEVSVFGLVPVIMNIIGLYRLVNSYVG